jgi:hypothetical protein
MRYVLDSNPRHAKFAARLLAFSQNREQHCSEVIEVGITPIEHLIPTDAFFSPLRTTFLKQTLDS